MNTFSPEEPFSAIPEYVAPRFTWHRFAAIQIWIFVLFLIYTSVEELNARLGDGELMKILFTRRSREMKSDGLCGIAVNQIVSKRSSKKQQMQRTKKDAHPVLQMRTQVLDERLEDTLRDWYPDFRTKSESEIKQAG